MREIETEITRARRQRKRQLILSVFMIVLLLGSTAGYAISLIGNDDGTTQDKSGKPYFDGSSWVVPYGSLSFNVQSSPDEAKNVLIEGDITSSLYAGRAVYLAVESPVLKQQVGEVLSAFAQRVQEACYGSCDSPDLPEKTCNEPLVVWRAADTNRVYRNASCVFIEGDYAAVDAFVYRILGYRELN